MDDELTVREFNRRRWLIWLPLALAFFASCFHRTATGVVADSLARDFAIAQASDLGGLASVYFYTYAVLQVPSGILADYYGPRRTISFSLLLAAAGAAVFAWADGLAGLYAGRFLSSAGVSVIYVNIMKFHAEWFRSREFGTMTGVIVFAGAVGFLASTAPLAYMTELVGWRASFLGIAAYSLAAAALCWLLVRDRPQEIGLPPVSRIEAMEGVSQEADSAPVQLGMVSGLKIVLGNPYTWLPFLIAVSFYGVYMAVIGLWGVSYLMQVYGMTKVAASGYMMAVTLGAMIGGPAIGILSDRLRRRRAPVVGFLTLFLLVWLLFTFWNDGKPPAWALYPLFFALGLGASGVNLCVACGKEVNPPQITGITAGVVNAGSFVGAALLQPAFGWVLDHGWLGAVEQGVRIYPQQAYQNAFELCAAALAVGLGAALFVKESYCKNISGSKF